MFNLFKTKPVLDEDSVVWLFDTFLWAEKFLDADTFYHDTCLVLPTDEYFPVNKDNKTNLAQVMLDQVKQYSSLTHWPTRLLEQESCAVEQPKLPYLSGAIRGSQAIDQSQNEESFFPILYNPAQVRNPQAMIGYYAQTLSYYLIVSAERHPEDLDINPGQLSEIVGVYMGFGVILSNSAFNYQNKTCGSCNTPTNDRTSYLSQYDITYALAIFCVLKGIDKKQALGALKSNLKSFFKKAYAEVKTREELSLFNKT